MATKKKKAAPKPRGDYKVGKGRPPPNRWYKGQPAANPEGGRAHDPIKKEIKRMASVDVKEILTILLEHPLWSVKRIADDKNEKVITRWFAKAVVHNLSKKNGSSVDLGPLDRILDRAIGPVSSKVELTGAGGGPVATTNATRVMTSQERIEEIEALRAARKKLERD